MILHASRPTPSFNVDHIVISVIMILRATRIQLSSHSSHSHTTILPPLVSTVTPQRSHGNIPRSLTRQELLPLTRTSNQTTHPTRHFQLTPSQTSQQQQPPLPNHDNGLRQFQTRILRPTRLQASSTKRLPTKRLSTPTTTAAAACTDRQNEKTERSQSCFEFGAFEYSCWVAMPSFAILRRD